MVSIRSKGIQPASQPVRFYKFVALTFLVLTIILLGFIVFMSAKRAEITIVTRSEPVEVDTIISIDSNDDQSLVSGFVTSTFVEISKTFGPEGTKTEEGIAEGTVTIYNETDFVQPLVATTRLLTLDGILFRLKTDVLVPAQGSLITEVYADKLGVGGDIGPTSFTIPGLREEKQKVVYAKSDTAMYGGIRQIGVVNQKDIEKAEKVLLEEMKKKGKESLEILSSEDQEGLYEVVQYTFENDAQLDVETDSFSVTGKATVLGVFYDAEILNSYAKDMLSKQVVGNSDILQSSEEMAGVVIDEYDLENSTAKLKVTHSGLVSLDPNSKELQKLMFFGKTEDEVRRYVMSLEHVQGIEMHFKPLWNRSVPHIASHVSVIIRQVE